MSGDDLREALDAIARDVRPPAGVEVVVAAHRRRARRGRTAAAAGTLAVLAIGTLVGRSLLPVDEVAAVPAAGSVGSSPSVGSLPSVGSSSASPPSSPRAAPSSRVAPPARPASPAPPAPDRPSGSATASAGRRPPTPSRHVDVGGSAAGGWSGDDPAAPGSPYTRRAPVDTSGVAGPAPVEVYQTCRYGPVLRYELSGLSPGTPYVLRLHWAELDFQNVGERVFAVSVDGVDLLRGVDVVALAGTRLRAVVRQLRVVPGPEGRVVVELRRDGPDNPFLSGLEVFPEARS